MPSLTALGPTPQPLSRAPDMTFGSSGVARVASDDTVKVTQSFEAGVPFFVWAEVPLWQQVPIPADVRSFEELESFVPKAAAAAGLDADKPLPFLVGGTPTPHRVPYCESHRRRTTQHGNA